jgi:hypothetical protein
MVGSDVVGISVGTETEGETLGCGNVGGVGVFVQSGPRVGVETTGALEGEVVGNWVVGYIVGSFVGLRVGNWLVGDLVGSLVGHLVGYPVVGKTVGYLVGSLVGVRV